MLQPIENGRRHEYKITDADDPLYLLTALVALIPAEEATVRASRAQFKADHHEVVEWDAYKARKREYDEEVKEAEAHKKEWNERVPRHTIDYDDDDDYLPTPPNEPTCAEPSAEYKKSFDERIAQFKRDMEFLDERRKSAREKLVAQVHPDLYTKGELGSVDHNAFCGHLGKRGRT